MKIRFTNAQGVTTELEISSDFHTNLVVDVSTEIGAAYQESIEAEKKNNRKNSRPDRHTKLSTFEYEDARFFSDSTDLLADLIESEAISHATSYLTERQQYLIQKCLLEGWKYTELAVLEGVDESAIRHAVNRVKNQLKKYLS